MVFKSLFSKSTNSQILNFLPDGLVVSDYSGNVLTANSLAWEMLHITNKHKITDILDVNINILEKLAENDIHSVFKVQRDDGEELYIEISASNAIEEQKLVFTLRNVTQSHKFMKKMIVETESSKKVNKDKNSFIVKIGSDLKSPLHSIEGFSKALLEGLGGALSEKQEKYLSIINKNSGELLYLLDKIIEMSRIEAGLYDWNYKHFDIVSMLHNTLRPYKETIEQKSISLNVNVEEIEKRTCFSDENAVKTVIDYLVDLSVRSTYLGSVTVKLSHPSLETLQEKGFEISENVTDRSYVMFTINDTGSGLTETEAAYIFDPYYQIECGNKKNLPKSIPLSISKAVIKNLNGKIWVTSEAMQGTTFGFIIPIERLSV